MAASREQAAEPGSRPDAIVAAARQSLVSGDEWAYLAGIVAIALGFALVWLRFPKRDDERALLARYEAEDAGMAPAA